MKLSLPGGLRLILSAALTCGAIVLPTLGLTGSAASAASDAVASCPAASTEVWAAVEGNGTAGTIFYDLEFSNVGSRPCTLRGYPDVWAITRGGAEIGKPASHRGSPSTVTLEPGATSHAILGVVDPGALCGSVGVTSAGLMVVPPGQRPAGDADEVEPFTVQVCAHESSMHVQPVHAGTGIPLYTIS
jgi:hypothetical protein